MRILHLLASPVWSGPAESVALLAQAQRALGHEVSAAVDRKRPRLAYEEPAAPRLAALGVLDEGGLELSVKSMPWRMVSDALALRRRALDVVHCHFSHDHHLARWGRPAGARVVRSIHAPRSLRGAPPADAWTVPTPAEARTLRGPWAVLPPLVADAFRPPDDRARLRAELGLSGAPVVGMVSTFQPSRRHALGLRAFAALRARAPGARLALVGDGPLAASVRAAAGEGVTFAGYQSGEAFIRWLQALDCVWILGLGNDFSGRAAAQARACGVKVVAAAEGALGDWADELVPTEPFPSSAEAICEATLREDRRPLTLPNAASVASRVLELYRECAGAQAGARA